MTRTTLLSVIIPCRNEANAITPVLQDLSRQLFDGPYEVVIADGCSTDGTWEILQAYQRKGGYPYRLKLLKNPARGVPQALNLMVADAAGDYIVRVDAHAKIPPDYVAGIADALSAGVDVVGPAIKYCPAVQTLEAQVIAALLNSRFCNGGTPSRSSLSQPARVKHAVMSCYHRRVWERIGGYDEALTSNEDFDFDYRANLAGFTVCALGAPTFYAISRPRLWSLALQRWRYGIAKARVLRKFPASLHVRQLVPILALPLTLLAALAPVLLATFGLVYLAVTLAVLLRSDLAAEVGGRTWLKIATVGTAAALIVHFVWSAGVWWGWATDWGRGRMVPNRTDGSSS
jgi:glycosyltransferase involved in cell wall biosynthesis